MQFKFAFFLFIIYLHSTLENKEFVKIKESMVCFPGYPVSTITDTVNFKTYRNKLTSSIRTSKAIYFSEAIKSGNNVGELWFSRLSSVNTMAIKQTNTHRTVNMPNISLETSQNGT
jgi:hypothetical protein